MLFRWPIKFKLFLCVGLLVVIVGVLAVNSLQGLYAYRELAKTISWRADEMPLADELSSRIGYAQETLRNVRQNSGTEVIGHEKPLVDAKADFNFKLGRIKDSLQQYRTHLDTDLPQFGQLGDRSRDRQTLAELATSLERLEKSKDEADWLLDDGTHVVSLIEQLRQMRDQVDLLKPQLFDRMHNLSSEVRGQYQTWISISWSTGISSAVGLLVLLGLFYRWVMKPLNVLIKGSRQIAKNDEFGHRILLTTHDEMAELADNMNAMTARFLEIKTDQESKIQQRTQEVVRSEQLASVGFLAAGVAHEINNPLASIAMCAESLETRVTDLLSSSPSSKGNAADREVVAKYLRRIQDEAFRCKGITERLLDFSRLGDVQKQPTDLRELVIGVVEMVRHLGDYREKKVEFQCTQHVVAPVNAQEMKQVVLNLITNALDSLDPGGTVWVELRRLGNQAELLVKDNGCGMSPDVLKHLFEPFYTRRRDGKGTGLGLSITFRIITEHGGTIEPSSGGPKKGSQMRVVLPLTIMDQKQHERQTQTRREAA
ncbi:MAG: sensor histidine kinase [Pirellulaceae bacterium]